MIADIQCLDLNHLGRPGLIGSFFIPHSTGAVLVDPGPGATLPALTAALAEHGLAPEQVTHVLLTHIHLDHAGAAGWFASQGAQVFVHPVGAPHMLNPDKLLASSRRIYGDRMDELWGEFIPVPAAQLSEVQDGADIAIGGLHFTALHTPGHAEHHVVYLLDDLCFSGDVGGVRRSGSRYVRLPFVPPETHLGKWRDSLKRIRAQKPARLGLVHFGIYPDADEHLEYALRSLDQAEGWLETVMPGLPDVEALRERYVAWLHERGLAEGVDAGTLRVYDEASPANMGASGLFRYWHKIRLGE